MFDFKNFIENLKENPEKKDIVEKYSKVVEPIPDKFEDAIIYKEYLSKFNTEWVVDNLKLPEFIDDDFDWNLLLRLIIGSFSSTYVLEYLPEEKKYELVINVSAW